MDERSILEFIQDPIAFGAFVDENMKNSTYKVGWDAEMTVEYEPSNNWSAATADYARAMLGTVIADNADRPKHDMPSIGEISGTLSRMGDEWQMDNERLKRFYYMEDRYRRTLPSLTDTQKNAEYKRLVQYLFEAYELAAIAPHRRILAQYYEGLSDGQVTLTKLNNDRGVIWSQPLPNGIKKFNLRASDTVWNNTTLESMDVLAVLQYIEEEADKAGKTVIKHRISKGTAALICQCDQFKKIIGTTFSTHKTDVTPGIGLNTINQYLASINGTGFAPFEVVNEIGTLVDGSSFSMFKDGRISAMCTDRVAVLKVSDALEYLDPVPNKVYTSFNDNLISQWRNEKGRYVAYEMSAFPAFTGRNNVFICDVTQKEA